MDGSEYHPVGLISFCSVVDVAYLLSVNNSATTESLNSSLKYYLSLIVFRVAAYQLLSAELCRTDNPALKKITVFLENIQLFGEQLKLAQLVWHDICIFTRREKHCTHGINESMALDRV